MIAVVADARRITVELLEAVIVTVGEAFLRRLDHDYDLPLISEGRMESDGPDAAEALDEVNDEYICWCFTHRGFVELCPDGCPSRARRTPAVSATAGSSAEVSADSLFSAPSAEHLTSAGTPAAGDDPGSSSPLDPGSPNLTWMGWALPAIWNVLGDHVAYPSFSVIVCHHADGTICAEFVDWQDWREHVGPIIAERIACDPPRAAASLLIGTRMETGQDMGAGVASEMFPQHQKK